MNDLVEIQVDDYAAGVKQFHRSVGWSYLTHRYPPPALELLERALTVSRVDPWDWAHCAMSLVMQRDNELGRVLAETGLGAVDASPLRRAVEAIQAYAAGRGDLLCEPPVAPIHLAAYGSTPATYARDVEEITGRPVDLRYLLPWPTVAPDPDDAPIQPVFLRQAAGFMGTTAGVIERLAALGGRHGRHK